MVPPRLLAEAWEPLLSSADQHELDRKHRQSAVMQAIERSLPLLDDVTSVPFVCRYRTDVIDPLTPKQVYQLQSLLAKHQSLDTLRRKVLATLPQDSVQASSSALVERIQTSTSKSELEDLYAPYKPPSKGSRLQMLQQDHPRLVEQVNLFWKQRLHPSGVDSAVVTLSSLQPRDAVVFLMSTKIADEPLIGDVVLQELRRHCRIQTKLTTTASSVPTKKTIKSETKLEFTYQTYGDFSCPLRHLKDFQVLAIRRGVQEKALTLSFDVDGDKIAQCIHYQLHRNTFRDDSNLSRDRSILTDAVRDAWTRLLRRRGTSRLWAQACQRALERAQQVFADNVYRALLAPPLRPIPSKVLALDPGFKAGIKCALINGYSGDVEKLETIHFLNNERSNAIQRLSQLLDTAVTTKGDSNLATVALGNGHGSQQAKALLLEAKAESGASHQLDIRLVNEAGASVWSVSDAAQAEFPDHPPASLAAVSIARRLLSPLHELVKVPPRSLGLGMYQHDLPPKELDQQLHVVAVDAVATVGVDVNSCSLEILEKVPGITQSLAGKVIQARPISKRVDLLRVAGLGPKTYENCAAFCRVTTLEEPLDSTLVHPESYDLARWLLSEMSWDLQPAPGQEPRIPERELWPEQWKDVLQNGSKRFGLSTERVLAVLGNLVDSILNVDPRINYKSSSATRYDSIGSPDQCVELSPELAENETALAQEAPVRGIVGTVRNIVDFGAFIDFGGHSDGLLHTSKLGPVSLESLLIGQQVGVDVISVKDGRISLALTGLDVTNASEARREKLLSKGAATTRILPTQKRSVSSKRKLDSTSARYGSNASAAKRVKS